MLVLLFFVFVLMVSPIGTLASKYISLLASLVAFLEIKADTFDQDVLWGSRAAESPVSAASKSFGPESLLISSSTL